MNRVKIFSDSDASALEAAINEWLAENKDIRILHTNLASTAYGDQDSHTQAVRNYVFYILYTKAKTSRRKKHTAEEVAIPEDLSSAVLPAKPDPSLPLSSHELQDDL